MPQGSVMSDLRWATLLAAGCSRWVGSVWC